MKPVMRRNVLFQSFQCIIAGLASLFFLNLFSLIYLHTGIHIRDTTGSTDYKWEPHQWKTTMEEGFAFLRMDSNGYCNREEDEKGNIDILLMGSSQMEGCHVRKDELLSSRLNDICFEYHTYSIGVSGHTIYHCINNMKAAYQVWHPRRFIILLIDTIDLSEVAMMKVIRGTWPCIPSYDSGMFYRIQKVVPAVKTIYKKLLDWHQASMPKKRPQKNFPSSPSLGSPNTTLREFLSIGISALKDTNCQLVIVYQPSTKIDRQGNFRYPDDIATRNRFSLICRELNIPFIDLTDAFENLYVHERRLAHGFANTAVGVGHLNAYGYKAIADSIVAFLSEE